MSRKIAHEQVMTTPSKSTVKKVGVTPPAKKPSPGAVTAKMPMPGKPLMPVAGMKKGKC